MSRLLYLRVTGTHGRDSVWQTWQQPGDDYCFLDSSPGHVTKGQVVFFATWIRPLVCPPQLCLLPAGVCLWSRQNVTIVMLQSDRRSCFQKKSSAVFFFSSRHLYYRVFFFLATSHVMLPAVWEHGAIVKCGLFLLQALRENKVSTYCQHSTGAWQSTPPPPLPGRDVFLQHYLRQQLRHAQAVHVLYTGGLYSDAGTVRRRWLHGENTEFRHFSFFFFFKGELWEPTLANHRAGEVGWPFGGRPTSIGERLRENLVIVGGESNK